MNTPTRAIITGASSGIGECFARQLAAKKVDLILVARRQELLEKLASDLNSKYGVKVEILSLDLSDPRSPETLLEFSLRSGQPIDLLINNAGAGPYRAFLKTPLADHLKILHLNLVSLTSLNHLFGQHMLAHGKPSTIINVASVASFQPVPKFALYCGTKSYVRIFSEIFHYEMKGTNVMVSCLCPGGTATEFLNSNNQKIKTGLSVLMSPEKVAEVGLRAAFNGKRVVVPGFFNKIQAILPRFFPNAWNLKIADVGMNIAVSEQTDKN